MAPTTWQLMRGRSSEIPSPTAPTGRNLPAKGVSPGTARQPFFGPEGDASTANIERADVDAIHPIRTAHPTTIHVRGADRSIHPGTKPSDDGFPGTRCWSDVAVDASPSGTVHACSAVPEFTHFAGRLRPFGAGCNGTCIRAHGPRWQVTPRWGWMQRHLYKGLRPSLAGCAPLGLDAPEPVQGFTPFAGRLRSVGAGCNWIRRYPSRCHMTPP